MWTVNSYYIAVIMSFGVMLLWGSWANTLKFIDEKKWPFILFIWDYSFGFLLMAFLLAITFGSFGPDTTQAFIHNILHSQFKFVLYALLAGSIFNLGNLFFIIAVELTGIAIAMTLGVGLSIILGVLINYLAAPSGNALFLFLGVGAIFIGILLSSYSYLRIPQAEHKHSKVKGILVAFAAGLLLSIFFRFLGLATNSQAVGALTPYAALVIFSFGLIISNKIWCFLLRTIKLTQNISPGLYFHGTFKEHSLGWLGGAMFSLGMALSILAADVAGFAISFGLAQSCIMISMIWGIFFWKEFKTSPKGTNAVLSLMFLCYLFGIILIVISH